MQTISGRSAIRGKAYGGLVYPWGQTLVPDLDPATGKLRQIALPGSWVRCTGDQDNLTLYNWAEINAQLLRGAPDGKTWQIGGLFIEFENNGGAAVSPPAFDRTGGKDYYDGLSSSGTRDYLRVPLTASTLQDESGGYGKVVTFFAQTAGVVGVHGKTYSDTVQSRVFGAALVAFPVADDATQDVVHSRFYYAEANQLIKQVGSQITVTWPLTLN